MGIVFSLVELVLLVAMLVGFWKVFEKAGKPGWNGIVPIYNMYILTTMIGKPAWWTVVMLIPVVNILGLIPFAARFGKDVGFAVGMGLLPFIFFPLLGFGDAKYNAGAPAPTPTP